jgi:exopolyphosphatase/guanosine-5'-triphosphate,3'-diphosphate pyrophosphatase
LPDKFLAAVDLGTNSFHLIIAKADKNGSFKVIDRERETIRLGSGSGYDLKWISPEEIEKAVAILKRFKNLAELYDAELKAVATSAVREADNNKEFINRIYTETGIEVEVIDGKREAGLIYKGVQCALPVGNKKVLCADIGGGSSEFISGSNGEVIFAESVKVGAVRLSKKFFPDFLLTEQSVKFCEEYIEQQILANSKINFSDTFEIAVGASGTLLSIAALIHYSRHNNKLKSLNGFSFSLKELGKITAVVLERKTVEERKLIEGMELKRADIIPAGLLILNKTFELFKLKEMIISEYGLREGIIVEMLSKMKSLI